MSSKWIFDRIMSILGLLGLSWLFFVITVIIKIKTGGRVFYSQRRVGRNGRLFYCHKFRTMKGEQEVSPVAALEQSRITPIGKTLRRYHLDELPQLWDVLIGNMSFVGPRPDVPGYADKLEGDDRDVLKLRPGITGPATLKYRLEDEMLEAFVYRVKNGLSGLSGDSSNSSNSSNSSISLNLSNISNLPDFSGLPDQEISIWYNDNVIYPDKVRLNCYYYRHYSFISDIKIIFATIFGKKIKYAGEEI